MLFNILVSLGITALIVSFVQVIFDYRLSGIIPVVIYLATLGLLQQVRKPISKNKYESEPDPDYSEWPTSGPIGHFGQYGLMVPWVITQLLCIFNPFQAVQIFKQLIGNAKLEAREKKTGDDGANYETKAIYTLPFRGKWFVYNGGMTPKTSHSWDVLGQRFALDFVKIDDKKRRHNGRGTHLDDYFCYSCEILAAADGVVIKVEDRVGTAPFLGWGICDFTARSFIGNHVLIQHADKEYALYAHLIKGKTKVIPGQTVKQGDVIGYCGHTGHSTEPHLHFHLQDSEDLFEGMGVPVRFHNLQVDGIEVEKAHLLAGNSVQTMMPHSKLPTT